jgi:hypothetical protein
MGLLWANLGFLTSNGKGFNRLNYERAGEVRTHQTNHLVVVQRRHYLIVGRLVEDLLHLLEEALPVEEGGGDERVLAQQDVLPLQSGVEVFVQQVKGLLVLAV